VGRLSRDVPEKFHEDDPALFVELAERGFSVRLMGATCIADRLGNHPRIEVLTAGSEPAPLFLGSLDVLLHRTSEHWFESFGRVVFEAMASGAVPVVGARGGYADFLSDGTDAILFRDNDEALVHMDRLRAQPELLAHMSAQARALVERMYGVEAKRAIQDFYFRA
jgi:glycosyltransferase involved in cell wall biosynthesis